MKTEHHPKQVSPDKMITTLTEIFNSVLNKPALKNLIYVTLAITLANTFRICEIARHLPTGAKTDKARKTRLLRLLNRAFPFENAMQCWLAFVLKKGGKTRKKYASILIDETKLIGGYKAIVAAIPFGQRAIPIYWLIYSNDEINAMKYTSHNQIIETFCTTVYRLTSAGLPKGCQPVLIFDRGFARARYVIKYFNEHKMPFLMRVPKNVGVEIEGVSKPLKEITDTRFYPTIVYHRTERLVLRLYAIIDAQYDDPMYLISNDLTRVQIRASYPQRMKIEHGFRDIKSCFGFGDLVLRKADKSRLSVLWFLAVITYGLLFILHQKSEYRWLKELCETEKSYSLIRVIKRVVSGRGLDGVGSVFCVRGVDSQSRATQFSHNGSFSPI